MKKKILLIALAGLLLFLAAKGAMLMDTLLPSSVESVESLFAKRREALEEIAADARGTFILKEEMSLKHRLLFFGSGLSYADGRTEDLSVSICFDYLPEGSLRLIHSPQGDGPLLNLLGSSSGAAAETIPPEGLREEGLGAGKKGYVEIRPLAEGWYIYAAFLPT